jgi:hypothetical protein
MVSPPVAIGLTLCDYALVEEGTKKVSLVGIFSGIRTTGFPSAPRTICVFAAFTDGLGEAIMDLSISRLETDEELYTNQQPVHFPDRFQEVRVRFRVHEFSFPAPGAYLFSLLADGEMVAQRRVTVYAIEEIPLASRLLSRATRTKL